MYTSGVGNQFFGHDCPSYPIPPVRPGPGWGPDLFGGGLIYPKVPIVRKARPLRSGFSGGPRYPLGGADSEQSLWIHPCINPWILSLRPRHASFTSSRINFDSTKTAFSWLSTVAESFFWACT